MFTPIDNGSDQLRRNRRITYIIVILSCLFALGIVGAYFLYLFI